MHKNNLYLLKTAITLPLATLAMAQYTKAQQKPNLVFIMADQWRGDALGCLGREPVITPNLDALAREGVNFTQAVSSYPVSSPARGMLMTGMYPHLSGVSQNCNSESAPFGVELRNDVDCWSDVLAKNGYELGYIGKWHLDAPHKPYVETNNNKGKIAWNEWTPPSRRHGFTHWISYGTYDQHLKPMYWQTNDGRNDWKFHEQWEAEYDADRAIEYIENKNNIRNADKPFALVVSINPPHTGYNLVPEKYKDIYKSLVVERLAQSRPDVMAANDENQKFFRESVRDYYACMTGVDENVGRIVNALKEQGLFENTIVVFTSDHGDCMGMHNLIGKNIYYDNAMRVPMIISFPKKIAPRRDDKTLIAFADLAPTLLTLLDQKIPETMQTKNLAENVLNENIKSPKFQPYFRLIASSPMHGVRGIRDSRYTYAINIKLENDEISEVLFDRQNDPYELQNIAAENPKLCAEYRKMLKSFLKKQNDNIEQEL